MLDTLFSSKTRVQVLGLFFEDENKKMYTQEIIKKLQIDPSNAQRELTKLADLGVLNSKKEGQHQYYSLIQDHDFYDGLKVIFQKHNENEKGEQWFVLLEMPSYYPQVVTSGWNVTMANDTLEAFGIKSKFTHFIAAYENNMCKCITKKNDFHNVSTEVVNSFISGPEFGEKYDKEVRETAANLVTLLQDIYATNLGELSNDQLADLFENYYKTYEHMHNYHWIQTCVDFDESLFTKHLMNYLKEKIEGTEHSLGEVFSILTTPTEESNASKEYKGLLNILEVIVNDEKLLKYFKETETRIITEDLKNIDSSVDELVAKQAIDWGWIGYNTMGPVWGKEYYIDLLCSLARQDADPTKLKKDMENDLQNTIKKQKEYIDELGMDEEFQRLFQVARNLVFTKGDRKDSMFYGYYVMENFFKELGRRFYLSIQQLRYYYPHELPVAIRSGEFNADQQNERFKYHLYHTQGHYSEATILNRAEADEFLGGLNIIQEDISDVKQLLGDCASAGRVRGEVKIVNIPADMEKMEEGNILISIATTPDLVPAIKKSAAIVTDVGGITCHAAIVSRELGIPCVIGTKFATKVLHDGDIVDVDATHGKVTIIKKVEDK